MVTKTPSNTAQHGAARTDNRIESPEISSPERLVEFVNHDWLLQKYKMNPDIEIDNDLESTPCLPLVNHSGSDDKNHHQNVSKGSFGEVIKLKTKKQHRRSVAVSKKKQHLLYSKENGHQDDTDNEIPELIDYNEVLHGSRISTHSVCNIQRQEPCLIAKSKPETNTYLVSDVSMLKSNTNDRNVKDLPSSDKSGKCNDVSVKDLPSNDTSGKFNDVSVKDLPRNDKSGKFNDISSHLSQPLKPKPNKDHMVVPLNCLHVPSTVHISEQPVATSSPVAIAKGPEVTNTYQDMISKTSSLDKQQIIFNFCKDMLDNSEAEGHHRISREKPERNLKPDNECSSITLPLLEQIKDTVCFVKDSNSTINQKPDGNSNELVSKVQHNMPLVTVVTLPILPKVSTARSVMSSGTSLVSSSKTFILQEPDVSGRDNGTSSAQCDVHKTMSGTTTNTEYHPVASQIGKTVNLHSSPMKHKHDIVIIEDNDDGQAINDDVIMISENGDSTITTEVPPRKKLRISSTETTGKDDDMQFNTDEDLNRLQNEFKHYETIFENLTELEERKKREQRELFFRKQKTLARLNEIKSKYRSLKAKKTTTDVDQNTNKISNGLVKITTPNDKCNEEKTSSKFYTASQVVCESEQVIKSPVLDLSKKSIVSINNDERKEKNINLTNNNVDKVLSLKKQDRVETFSENIECITSVSEKSTACSWKEIQEDQNNVQIPGDNSKDTMVSSKDKSVEAGVDNKGQKLHISKVDSKYETVESILNTIINAVICIVMTDEIKPVDKNTVINNKVSEINAKNTKAIEIISDINDKNCKITNDTHVYNGEKSKIIIDTQANTTGEKSKIISDTQANTTDKSKEVDKTKGNQDIETLVQNTLNRVVGPTKESGRGRPRGRRGRKPNQPSVNRMPLDSSTLQLHPNTHTPYESSPNMSVDRNGNFIQPSQGRSYPRYPGMPPVQRIRGQVYHRSQNNVAFMQQRFRNADPGYSQHTRPRFPIASNLELVRGFNQQTVQGRPPYVNNATHGISNGQHRPNIQPPPHGGGMAPDSQIHHQISPDGKYILIRPEHNANSQPTIRVPPQNGRPENTQQFEIQKNFALGPRAMIVNSQTQVIHHQGQPEIPVQMRQPPPLVQPMYPPNVIAPMSNNQPHIEINTGAQTISETHNGVTQGAPHIVIQPENLTPPVDGGSIATSSSVMGQGHIQTFTPNNQQQVVISPSEPPMVATNNQLYTVQPRFSHNNNNELAQYAQISPGQDYRRFVRPPQQVSIAINSALQSNSNMPRFVSPIAAIIRPLQNDIVTKQLEKDRAMINTSVSPFKETVKLSLDYNEVYNDRAKNDSHLPGFQHVQSTVDDTPDVEITHAKLGPNRGRQFKRSPSESHEVPVPTAAEVQKPAKEAKNKVPKKLSCSHCGKDAIFVCSGCKRIPYCSEQCQNDQWQDHCNSCV